MFERFLSRLLKQCETPSLQVRVIWNRRDEQLRRWDARDPSTTLRRPGTKEEALAKLFECESALFSEERACAPLSSWIDRLRVELECLPDDAAVGDPFHVSRIFRPCLCVGYTIEYDMTTGLRRDHFELRDGALFLLTTSSEIWASPLVIVRHESNGSEEAW